MNKAEKEVMKASLNSEKKTINELKQVYKQARKDIKQNIIDLNARKDMQNIQTIVYQKKYQEALLKQVEETISKLEKGQYSTVEGYLTDSYYNGYVGHMYDLQYQGIPITVPINQKRVVMSVQTNSNISTKLYTMMGENVTYLKNSIRAELSRGAVEGKSWFEIAERIANGMNSPFNKALNRTVTIARTEGHRVQEEATFEAMQIAKDKGADQVKQWDATLDSRTRPAHQEADGQLRELDEFFEVGGEKMKAPHIGGSARNVVNCRCHLLARARWALGDAELQTLQNRANFFGLDKSNDFEEYKKKYLKLPKNADKMKIETDGWIGLNYSQNYSSKKDAIKALNNKYGISFSDSRKYPIDETMICDFVSWMDSFEKQYPEFVKNNPVKVPKVCVKAPSSMKNSVGYFQYYLGGQPIELALNGYYHSSMKVFEEYEKRCIQSKWTVANATFHKTFVHEYGHYVSNTIRKMKSDNAWEHNFIKECIEEFKKEVPEYDKNTYIGLGDYVSRYGSTSESECFAEAFAEYFGNENPRTFAKIFGTKLEKVLKGVD